MRPRRARARRELPEAVRLMFAGEPVPDTVENRAVVIGVAYFSEHPDLGLEPAAHAQLHEWREAAR